MSDEMVTITKIEYDDLKADSEWLGCLEAAGVDNWSGYDLAIQYRYGGEDDGAE